MSVIEVSRPAQRRAEIRDSLPTDHPAVLDQIAALMDTLPDPAELGPDHAAGSLGITAQLRNRFEAYLVGLAGAADNTGAAQILHAGTTGTLVAAATTANPATGSGLVGAARALRNLPHVTEGFNTGRLNWAHVQALRTAAGQIEDFEQIEQALVEIAASVEPGELRRILNLLIGQSQPETLDDDHQAQHAKRALYLSETPNGMFRLDGWLDALAGRRLRTALEAFTDPHTPADPRTPAQTRADALADLTAAACANTNQTGICELSILVDLDTLPEATGATLDDGQPLGPATFDLLSCAVACAVIFGVNRDHTFVPLALARTQRRATRWQWAALKARDRGCIRCGRAPRYCHAHHIVHWRHGGLTDLSNPALLCPRCHADLHHGHYTITMSPQGVPTITPTPRAPP